MLLCAGFESWMRQGGSCFPCINICCFNLDAYGLEAKLKIFPSSNIRAELITLVQQYQGDFSPLGSWP